MLATPQIHQPRSQSPTRPENQLEIASNIKYYDELATSYESAFSHDPGLHAFIHRALTHIPPHSHVLDLGCGTGKPVATTISAAGHHITGIDLSPVMIAQCRAQVPLGMFYASSMLSWTPTPSQPLSAAIFTIFSLFMLSPAELKDMLGKMHGWMQEGGILCLGTILAEDLDTNSAVWEEEGVATGVEMMFMGSKSKMTVLTEEGWRDILREKGFDVCRVEKERFIPRAEGVETDDEMHCFIMARKVEMEDM